MKFFEPPGGEAREAIPGGSGGLIFSVLHA